MYFLFFLVNSTLVMYSPPTLPSPSLPLFVFPVQHQQIFRRKKKLIKKKTKNPIVRNPPHQNWIQDSRLQKERRKKNEEVLMVITHLIATRSFKKHHKLIHKIKIKKNRKQNRKQNIT